MGTGKSRIIRVSADVYEQLQELAEPFVDSPNDIIRILIEYYHSNKHAAHIKEKE